MQRAKALPKQIHTGLLGTSHVTSIPSMPSKSNWKKKELKKESTQVCGEK
jgi:hypothetical protein